MKKITEDEVRRTYDNIASVYDKKRTDKTIYNDYIEMPATLSLLKDIRGKKILDLGCGTGVLSKILKKRGAIVSGVDISPKMIEIAKRNVKSVDFRLGSFYRIPYKSGSFDIVVASLVMHYASDLYKSFKEVKRILKKDGFFVFSGDNPVLHVTKRIKGKPRNYRMIGDYFKEGKIYAKWKMLQTKMPYQHITFETWMKVIIKSGFVIEDYIDAKPTPEARKIDKERYGFLSKVPWFFVFKLRKS